MKIFNDDSAQEQEPEDEKPKRWLDNQDLLMLTNVTDRTLRNWRKKKYLPFTPNENTLRPQGSGKSFG